MISGYQHAIWFEDCVSQVSWKSAKIGNLQFVDRNFAVYVPDSTVLEYLNFGTSR
jgi:hypothetical protein